MNDEDGQFGAPNGRSERMNECESCTHWAGAGKGGFGSCARIETVKHYDVHLDLDHGGATPAELLDESQLAAVELVDGSDDGEGSAAYLVTRSSFGCALHELRAVPGKFNIYVVMP